jgi:hypothetical protein
MEVICSSETLVHIWTIWHYIPEDGNCNYNVVGKSVMQCLWFAFFSFISSLENVNVDVAWSIYYITGVVDVIPP